MIRINLLPVREERRRADLRQFGVLLAATLLGSLLVVGFFHWKVKSDVESVNQQVAATQRQIDQFGPQLEQVKVYRDTKAQIERKLEVIERLDDSRSGPVHLMDELATHTPERLWVTRIQAEKQMIRIEGMSLDNELVAHFLTALNSSPYFRDVELRETEAKEEGGFKLNHFELSAGITSPAAEKRARKSASDPQESAGADPQRAAGAGGGQSLHADRQDLAYAGAPVGTGR